MQTLPAFEQQPDTRRLITEKLRVKEIEPADHIRTKHEDDVTAFVEAVNLRESWALIQHA
jgi:hypothetical protein